MIFENITFAGITFKAPKRDDDSTCFTVPVPALKKISQSPHVLVILTNDDNGGIVHEAAKDAIIKELDMHGKPNVSCIDMDAREIRYCPLRSRGYSIVEKAISFDNLPIGERFTLIPDPLHYTEVMEKVNDKLYQHIRINPETQQRYETYPIAKQEVYRCGIRKTLTRHRLMKMFIMYVESCMDCEKRVDPVSFGEWYDLIQYRN